MSDKQVRLKLYGSNVDYVEGIMEVSGRTFTQVINDILREADKQSSLKGSQDKLEFNNDTTHDTRTQ